MKPIGFAPGEAMLDLASALGAKPDVAASVSQPSFQAVLASALQGTATTPNGQPATVSTPDAAASSPPDASTSALDASIPGTSAASENSAEASVGAGIEVGVPAPQALPAPRGTMPGLTRGARPTMRPATIAVDQMPSPGAPVRPVAVPTAFAAASMSIRQRGRGPEGDAPAVRKSVARVVTPDVEERPDAAGAADQVPTPTPLSLAVMAAGLATDSRLPASAVLGESDARQHAAEQRSPSDSTASTPTIPSAFASGRRTTSGGRPVASPAAPPDADAAEEAKTPVDARLASLAPSLEVEVELGSGRRTPLSGQRGDLGDPTRLDANPGEGDATSALAAKATLAGKVPAAPAVGRANQLYGARRPTGERDTSAVVADGKAETEARPSRPSLEAPPVAASAARPAADDAARAVRRAGASERDGAASHAGAESATPATPLGLGVEGAALRTSGPREAEGGDTLGASRTAEPKEPPPQATDRVTVHLPDEAGGGRIQIAVRGDVVHARIVGGDQAMAARLDSGLGELHGALAQQGFQETHVRVDAPISTDKGWATPAGTPTGGDAKQHGSETPERRERDRAQHDPHSDPRQQRDGRSQQRARRERER